MKFYAVIIAMLCAVFCFSHFYAQSEIRHLYLVPYSYDKKGQLHVLLTQYKGKYQLLHSTKCVDEATFDAVKTRILASNKLDQNMAYQQKLYTVNEMPADNKSAVLFFACAMQQAAHASLKWFLIPEYHNDVAGHVQKDGAVLAPCSRVALQHKEIIHLVHCR